MMFLFDETRWRSAFTATGVVWVVGQAIEEKPNMAGIALLLLVVGLTGIRWLALRRAIWALEPYRLKYDKRWIPVADANADILKGFAARVQRCHQRPVRQPSDELDALYWRANAIHPWFKEYICRVINVLNNGDEHDATPGSFDAKVPGVKQTERVLQKIARSYKGDSARVLDLVRVTIIVNTILEAIAAYELMVTNTNVHVVKNKFDPDFDSQASGGYRDLSLLITFDELIGTVFERFVFEVQINLRTIMEVKTAEGHKCYVAVRNLRCD